MLASILKVPQNNLIKYKYKDSFFFFKKYWWQGISINIQKLLYTSQTETLNYPFFHPHAHYQLFFFKLRHLSLRLTDVRPTKLYFFSIFAQFPVPYSSTPSSNHLVSSALQNFFAEPTGSLILRCRGLAREGSAAQENHFRSCFWKRLKHLLYCTATITDKNLP